MSIKALERSARKAEQRQARIACWRLADNWRGFLAYLYWRNRFPVLNKLFYRAALFIELYLLYIFFHGRVAGALGFILFCIFGFKSIFSGIIQYFRLKIVGEKDARHPAQVNRLFYILQLWSTVAGIAFAAGLTALAFVYAEQDTSIGFVAVWIAVLPLELCSSACWAIVYTKRRLRRSFWIVLGCRLLPSLVILLFHAPLGAYCYALGLLAARSIENSYLLLIARNELLEQGVKAEKPAKKTALLQEILGSGAFWGHSLFPVPHQLYNFLIGLMLFLRDEELWLTHLVFFYMVLTFAYPSLRIAQSIEMDIYLALRNGDLPLAQRFKRRVEQAVLVFLTATAAGLTAFFLWKTAFFTVGGSVLYELWLYFIAVLIARTLFHTQSSLYRAAGTERYFTYWLFGVFAAALIPLQTLLIFYFRANLPLIYLADALFFLALAARLRYRENFEFSEIYNGVISRQVRNENLLSPALWLKFFAAWRKTGLCYSLMLFQFDWRYAPALLKKQLLGRISKVLGRHELVFQVLPGVFLCLLPGYDREDGRRKRDVLLARCGGHVRHAVVLDPAQPFEANLQTALEMVGRMRQFSCELRRVQSALCRIIKEKRIVGLRHAISLWDLSHFSLRQILQVVTQLLRERGLSGAPAVFFDGRRRRISGRVTVEHLQFAHRVFLRYSGLAMLIPAAQAPYVVFAVFGAPLAVFDTSSLGNQERGELQQLAVEIALFVSAEIAVQAEDESNVPISLFELLHSKLKQELGNKTALIEPSAGNAGAGALLRTRTPSGMRCLYYEGA